MPQELYRLIARYRWLQQELSQHLASEATTNASHVAAALEDVFLRIVRFQADDPSISYCQIEFLLAMLAEGTRDKKLREILHNATLAHVKRLADRAMPTHPTVAAN